jgi:acyl-coenzyme A thioesterase PaaI-like protein
MVNKRETARININGIVSIEKDNQEHLKPIVNFSKTGACVQLDDDFVYEHDNLFISLPLNNSKKINCKVIWSIKDKNNGYRLYGLKFIDFIINDEKELKQLILNLSTPPKKLDYISNNPSLKKITDISWGGHYKKCVGTLPLLSSYLRKAVPLLGFVNWEVLEYREGYCKSVIPFMNDSKNQNTTHQAALFLLTADYTGGIALGSAIRGLPSFGIHPDNFDDDYGLVYWLIKAKTEFVKQSKGNLFATAKIPEEELLSIKTSLLKRGRIVKNLDVVLTNDNDDISAKVTNKYLMQIVAYKEFQEINM